MGGAVLVVVVALLVKYSFERDLIPPALRVAMGFLFGALLYGGADFVTKRGYPRIANALTGIGTAFLYGTSAMAYHVYDLFGQELAFGVMIVVTVLAFVAALRRESHTVAALGALGGFLTPFMLASDTANIPALFTYLALLTAATSALTYYKPGWVAVNYITNIGCWLVAGAVVGSIDQISATTQAVSLYLFWLPMAAVEMLKFRKHGAEFATPRTVATLLGLAGFLIVSAKFLEGDHTRLSYLLLAASASFGVLMFTFRDRLLEHMTIVRTYIIAILMMLVAAVEYGAGAPAEMYWLVLLVAGSHALAWTMKDRLLTVLSSVLSVLLVLFTAVRLTFSDHLFRSPHLFLNHSFAICFATALVSLLPGYFLSCRSAFGAAVTRSVPMLKHLLVVSGILMVLLGFAIEGGERGASALALSELPHIPSNTMAFAFVGLGMLLLLAAGLGLKFRELLLHCVFFAPIALLLPLPVVHNESTVFLPVLTATAVFIWCTFIVRRDTELPRWLSHYNGIGFSLLAVFTAWALPEVVGVSFPRTHAYFGGVLNDAYKLVGIVAVCHGLGYLIRCRYLSVTACLLSIYAADALCNDPWLQRYAPPEATMFLTHPFLLSSVAALLSLLPAWVLSKKKKESQPAAALLTALTYLLVFSGCLAFLTGMGHEGWWRMPEGIPLPWGRGILEVRGDGFAALVTLAIGLGLLSGLGVLARFRELFVVTVFAAPIIAGVTTLGGLAVSDDAGIAAALILFALVFAYQAWVQLRAPREGLLSKVMLVYTEVTLCVFAFFASIAVAGSMFAVDWYQDRNWQIVSPFVILSWTVLSLAAVWFSRSSGRLTFRIAALIAFGLALLAGMFSGMKYPDSLYSPVFNARTIGLLLSAAFGIASGAVLFRERIFKAFVPWGNALRVLSTVFIVFVATYEVNDLFNMLTALADAGDLEVPSTDTASLMHLSNLKSMSISVVWVIYAAFTMGVGLWLRARWLRLISLAVLLVTIAKVFLYDLSFLGTVHRIISFLFLGVLLILISWLYTRFRSVLTGSEETSEPAEPSASPEPPDPPQQP